MLDLNHARQQTMELGRLIGTFAVAQELLDRVAANLGVAAWVEVRDNRRTLFRRNPEHTDLVYSWPLLRIAARQPLIHQVRLRPAGENRWRPPPILDDNFVPWMVPDDHGGEFAIGCGAELTMTYKDDGTLYGIRCPGGGPMKRLKTIDGSEIPLRWRLTAWDWSGGKPGEWTRSDQHMFDPARLDPTIERTLVIRVQRWED